jgi:phage/plasmid-like protein (TIGR03299 family)
MAHELTIAAGGIAEMAFVGQTPWHGLGQQLVPGASIEDWRLAAGMNWEILRAPVQYGIERKTPVENTYVGGNANPESDIIIVPHLKTWAQQEVLYRSDTEAPLNVVSNQYSIVQPGQVLEFFRDLVAEHGFELETAGTLKGGKRFWALARTGLDGDVVEGDTVRTYLLLVSSCDSGLATTAMFTSVRVVCNNTLQMSLTGDSAKRVSVRHNTEFNPNSVKLQLGLNADEVYGSFMSRMRLFSNKSLSGSLAEEIVETMFANLGRKGDIRESKGFGKVLDLFNATGKGSQIDGVAGTGWGLINAVTEYADFHVRARSQEFRLDSSWFGAGRAMKETILELMEEV